ncbi:hypothetical protein [Streptomyces sp. NPDC001068]|uniref:hypothetical protein n=1 Tax=Streptomyces sp. NPDC001068 TaxID=3364544 RepID=UPI0036BAE6FA
MSEESFPEQSDPSDPPKGLLQQMEELMAALNADLSDLHREAGFTDCDSRECVGGPLND